MEKSPHISQPHNTTEISDLSKRDQDIELRPLTDADISSMLSPANIMSLKQEFDKACIGLDERVYSGDKTGDKMNAQADALVANKARIEAKLIDKYIQTGIGKDQPKRESDAQVVGAISDSLKMSYKELEKLERLKKPLAVTEDILKQRNYASENEAFFEAVIGHSLGSHVQKIEVEPVHKESESPEEARDVPASIEASIEAKFEDPEVDRMTNLVNEVVWKAVVPVYDMATSQGIPLEDLSNKMLNDLKDRIDSVLENHQIDDIEFMNQFEDKLFARVDEVKQMYLESSADQDEGQDLMLTGLDTLYRTIQELSNGDSLNLGDAGRKAARDEYEDTVDAMLDLSFDLIVRDDGNNPVLQERTLKELDRRYDFDEADVQRLRKRLDMYNNHLQEVSTNQSGDKQPWLTLERRQQQLERVSQTMIENVFMPLFEEAYQQRGDGLKVGDPEYNDALSKATDEINSRLDAATRIKEGVWDADAIELIESFTHSKLVDLMSSGLYDALPMIITNSDAGASAADQAVRNDHVDPAHTTIFDLPSTQTDTPVAQEADLTWDDRSVVDIISTTTPARDDQSVIDIVAATTPVGDTVSSRQTRLSLSAVRRARRAGKTPLPPTADDLIRLDSELAQPRLDDAVLLDVDLAPPMSEELTPIDQQSTTQTVEAAARLSRAERKRMKAEQAAEAKVEEERIYKATVEDKLKQEGRVLESDALWKSVDEVSEKLKGSQMGTLKGKLGFIRDQIDAEYIRTWATNNPEKTIGDFTATDPIFTAVQLVGFETIEKEPAIKAGGKLIRERANMRFMRDVMSTYSGLIKAQRRAQLQTTL